ncbi:MAG: ROK family protein [Allobaculum sp.]
MKDAKEYLANMIAIIYAIDDPDIVILGGSVAMKTPGFVEDVEARVKEKVYPVLVPYICVRRSTLNEDSGLIGAGALGFSKAA